MSHQLRCKAGAHRVSDFAASQRSQAQALHTAGAVKGAPVLARRRLRLPRHTTKVVRLHCVAIKASARLL